MSNEVLSDKERIAVLETRMFTVEQLLVKIDTKLDELVDLKAKGMGAIGLVGLIVGSGVIGLIITFWNIVKGTHL